MAAAAVSNDDQAAAFSPAYESGAEDYGGQATGEDADYEDAVGNNATIAVGQPS